MQDLRYLTDHYDEKIRKIKEIGTISETAFDVFSITDSQIYMTRFGAGEDRVGTIMRTNSQK